MSRRAGAELLLARQHFNQHWSDIDQYQGRLYFIRMLVCVITQTLTIGKQICVDLKYLGCKKICAFATYLNLNSFFCHEPHHFVLKAWNTNFWQNWLDLIVVAKARTIPELTAIHQWKNFGVIFSSQHKSKLASLKVIVRSSIICCGRVVIGMRTQH